MHRTLYYSLGLDSIVHLPSIGFRINERLPPPSHHNSSISLFSVAVGRLDPILTAGRHTLDSSIVHFPFIPSVSVPLA